MIMGIDLTNDKGYFCIEFIVRVETKDDKLVIIMDGDIAYLQKVLLDYVFVYSKLHNRITLEIPMAEIKHFSISTEDEEDD
jgi:hypothetical protein